MENSEPLHIGKIIESVMRSQGRSPSWLAAQICCNRDNIYKIFRRQHIDTELLLDISVALDFNFFQYYVDALRTKKIQNVSQTDTQSRL